MTRRISVSMAVYAECEKREEETGDYEGFEEVLREKGIIKACEVVYGLAYSDHVSYVVLDVGCGVECDN